MNAVRVIPCLDVDRGRVVKGVQFEELVDAGDPVELAAFYDKEGADEVVFLDITASSDGRDTMVDVVERTAAKVFIPLTVGGGVRNVEDARKLLRAGADKVAVNSAALDRPELISDISSEFGVQCVVVAIDAKRLPSEGLGDPGWSVYVHGGRINTGRDVIEWAHEAESCGAGEILLTSMDRDGTKDGFDLDLTARVSDEIGIPLIASGGVGGLSHLVEGVKLGHADAVLAASVFHFRELTVKRAKEELSRQGVRVRP